MIELACPVCGETSWYQIDISSSGNVMVGMSPDVCQCWWSDQQIAGFKAEAQKKLVMHIRDDIQNWRFSL